MKKLIITGLTEQTVPIIERVGDSSVKGSRAIRGFSSLIIEERLVDLVQLESLRFHGLIKFSEYSVRDFVGPLGATLVTRSGVVMSYVTTFIPDNWKEDSDIDGLRLGDIVTRIGDRAFYNCVGLSGSLVIPNSVVSIGGFAFGACSGFDGSLVIGDRVTRIGDFAFANCVGLSGSLVIPSGVVSIGEAAFGACSGFDGNLVIPNSVVSIGEDAFNICSGFDGSLVVGSGVVSIGEDAFSGCSGVTRVEVRALVAPVIGVGAFSGMSGVSPAVIHVPVGASGYAVSYDGLTVVFDL